jgi:hypothetical protein
MKNPIEVKVRQFAIMRTILTRAGFSRTPILCPNPELEKVSDGYAVRTNPLARGTLRVSKGAIES